MNPTTLLGATLVAILAAPISAGPAADIPEFDCGFRGPEYWLVEIRKGVERGEIADCPICDP